MLEWYCSRSQGQHQSCHATCTAPSRKKPNFIVPRDIGPPMKPRTTSKPPRPCNMHHRASEPAPSSRQEGCRLSILSSRAHKTFQAKTNRLPILKMTEMTPSTVPIAGSLRFESDKRQIGALLMLLGFCAIVQPLAGIAASIGPDETTVNEGIPLSSFIGGLCLAKIGVLSVFTGYNEAVHDWGNRYLTAYVIIFVQTAFIPYITDMVNIGRTARDEKMFIPEGYMPSQTDYNVVGAFGIISVIAYGFTFVGSISFMLFSLYAFQNGKPESRNAAYYRGRMGFYCGMLFLAGIAQLVLGSYIQTNFGGGELEFGPIAVAMYVVSFPAISIFVGLTQILNGIWGLARFLKLKGFSESNDSYKYQMSIFFGWFMQFVLQAVTQVGYLPGGDASQAVAVITTLSVGLNLMPAYLDFKARSVPEEINAGYYTLVVADSTIKQANASMIKDDIDSVHIPDESAEA